MEKMKLVKVMMSLLRFWERERVLKIVF